MPGTYNENILWENKNLVIKSYSGREHTIIDGQNLNNVFKISNVDSTSLLEGFTLRNGDATTNGTSYPQNSGGGILLHGNVNYIKLKNLLLSNVMEKTGIWNLFKGSKSCIRKLNYSK